MARSTSGVPFARASSLVAHDPPPECPPLELPLQWRDPPSFQHSIPVSWMSDSPDAAQTTIIARESQIRPLSTPTRDPPSSRPHSQSALEPVNPPSNLPAAFPHSSMIPLSLPFSSLDPTTSVDPDFKDDFDPNPIHNCLPGLVANLLPVSSAIFKPTMTSSYSSFSVSPSHKGSTSAGNQPPPFHGGSSGAISQPPPFHGGAALVGLTDSSGGGDGTLAAPVVTIHGINDENHEEQIKKKWGQPRKYSRAGSMSLALTKISPTSTASPGSVVFSSLSIGQLNITNPASQGWDVQEVQTEIFNSYEN
ncbi:hypothetical protein IEQ34_015734 [Dendrobium chrysotoxum]|uniref:Uncharacterized protein n=1 Tax=Dendrobium chrysotoxum TaxID=161865 RepID=A0AAV7GJR2_DENCH|nr:hypothetical protein IEQ34_015734 [Dendrobium chrysotoxum]